MAEQPEHALVGFWTQLQHAARSPGSATFPRAVIEARNPETGHSLECAFDLLINNEKRSH